MGVGGVTVVPEDDATIAATKAAAATASASFFAFHCAPSLIMRDVEGFSALVDFLSVCLVFLEGGGPVLSTSLDAACSSEMTSEALCLVLAFEPAGFLPFPAGCFPLPMVVSSSPSESTTIQRAVNFFDRGRSESLPSELTLVGTSMIHQETLTLL